ncbi:Small-conductance mechanosensitive channel [Maribacter orientalis]|uniref:Small-conductance mechanosensitive channel n=1 Tax=Maribacter orientalis TaxID=228957 RepID=A0A1H7TTM8_9FLAO|nr:mechanosensitive ion channel domain-containing protein [Maribacter orientalis]SEL88003.1 Small-conductance mechanosensitive channel [Maribacter orientalis]|tara:strand:- start:376 stop:1440 length:1065 start_codon:yes stop_codon:yes gene_type:complete
MQNLTNNPILLAYIFGAILVLLLLQLITVKLLRRLGKNPKYLLDKEDIKNITKPIFIIFIAIAIRIKTFHNLLGFEEVTYLLSKISTISIIFAFTWLLIIGLKITKRKIIKNYDVNSVDNYRARKVYTQFNILERIIIFVIIIIGVSIALMSFESIREIGVSIFASAGVAGIIVGLSAQKMIASILAGIQIAIAQPIKIDDVVIVESEWGRIEEITLTYVVVNIWDKRRLIVPTSYFIEKPFQNWTKKSADLLGTIYLYTDYRVSFDALRKELERVLKTTDLWDGANQNIQVTDSKPTCVEIRAMVSAQDASTLWDLRVFVREKLITFLQENYPESIVRTRVQIENNSKEGNNL